jgi:hypothetical protein
MDMIKSQDCLEFSYIQWLDDIVENLCSTWSTQLGGGQKGTDAYRDHKGWLSLAYTVSQTLNRFNPPFQNYSSNCQGVNLSEGFRSKRSSSLEQLQFKLSHSILRKAFPDQSFETVFEEDTKLFMSKINRILNDVPKSLLDSFKTIQLSLFGLSNLETSSGETNGTKCFAIMEITTLCFLKSVGDIQSQIKQHQVEVITDVEHEDNKTKLIEVENNSANSLISVFEKLEQNAGSISQKSRNLIMQNKCFSFTSQLAESLRNYARLRNDKYAPRSARIIKQRTADSYL